MSAAPNLNAELSRALGLPPDAEAIRKIAFSYRLVPFGSNE